MSKKNKKLNPAPFFILGVFLIIAVGGFFILGGGEKEIDYFDFAECLAESDATMYGFKACPNCAKQEHIIGSNAFKQYIEDAGLYVKCRPESEAVKTIGERVNRISILPHYEGEITEATTQGELCALMVGIGTPTWIINERQVSGWQTIPELSELSGCPVPDNFKEVAVTGERVTPVGG